MSFCTRHNKPIHDTRHYYGMTDITPRWCTDCHTAAYHFPFDEHYKDHPVAIEQREKHHREVKIAQARLNTTPVPPKRSYSNKPAGYKVRQYLRLITPGNILNSAKQKPS